MAFITKLCSSIIRNGFNNITSNSILKPTASVRNFHLLMKPLPKSVIEATWSQDSIFTGAGLQPLLAPVSLLLNQVAGFKVKGSLKRRCKDCYFVMRQQRMYVICPTHPRHKQMAIKKRDYKSWILTHATQSKICLGMVKVRTCLRWKPLAIIGSEVLIDGDFGNRKFKRSRMVH